MSENLTEQTENIFHDLWERVVSTIKQKMVQRGFNQSELARKMGVSRARVSRILNKKENLTLKTIAQITQILEIKWDLVGKGRKK